MCVDVKRNQVTQINHGNIQMITVYWVTAFQLPPTSVSIMRACAPAVLSKFHFALHPLSHEIFSIASDAQSRLVTTLLLADPGLLPVHGYLQTAKYYASLSPQPCIAPAAAHASNRVAAAPLKLHRNSHTELAMIARRSIDGQEHLALLVRSRLAFSA